MRNKIFTKIIITTLLVTFLTFNVGRVTRVSAVATTAAIASAALVGTGAIFLAYLALTNADVSIPSTNDVENYLRDVGSKVVYYTSGQAIYDNIYNKLLHGLVYEDINISFTPLTLQNLYNDFKDIEIIQSICGFSYINDVPLANFDFSSYTLNIPQTVYTSNSTLSLDYFYESYNIVTPSGPRIALFGSDTYFPFYTNFNYPIRNRLTSNGYYYAQYFNGSSWQDLTTVNALYECLNISNGNRVGYLKPSTRSSWQFVDTVGVTSIARARAPVWIDADIYVESTGETIRHLEDSEVEVISPTYHYGPNDDEDPQGPIVPYVFNPPAPTNGNGNLGWGFNLDDLLDKLLDLSLDAFKLADILALINQFKDALVGTDEYNNYYYLDLSDDDTYNYFSNVYNDFDYPVYNINIISQEYAIPVDLNTIQNYSSNRYLETIKQSAVNGSSIIRDLAVFWYDVDPEVTYIALGCCIAILLGAFVGKLGHS